LKGNRTNRRTVLRDDAPAAGVRDHLFDLPRPRYGAAALLLSVVLSCPLAHMFELGGGTIWPPAIGREPDVC